MPLPINAIFRAWQAHRTHRAVEPPVNHDFARATGPAQLDGVRYLLIR